MTSSPDRRPLPTLELVLPDDWHRISADPERAPAQIDAFLHRVYRGFSRDRTASIRRALRGDLLAQVSEAAEAHAVEMLLCTMEVAGRPLSASGLVSLQPVDISHSEVRESFLDGVSEPGLIAKEPVEFAWGTGAAVIYDREHRSPVESATLSFIRAQDWYADVDDAARSALTDMTGWSRHVDVHVPVPGTDATLLLAFSTSVRPAADALGRLFLAIASTVRFS